MAKRDIKKLSEGDLESIREDWSSGDMEPVEVAKKHNILSNDLRKFAHKQEWGPPGKPVSNSNGVGRKPAYSPEFAHMAYVACSEGGFTREKLGKLFFVSKMTIHNWMNQYPEFDEQVRKGSDEYDVKQAEESLKKRVNGFYYNEITKEPVPEFEEVETVDEETGKVKIEKKIVGTRMAVSKSVRKFIPPEPRTIEFFLCNRGMGRWRNTSKLELTGEGGGPVKVDHGVDDVLAAAMGVVTDTTPTLPNLSQKKITDVDE